MRALILACLLLLAAPALGQAAPRWPYAGLQLGLEDNEGGAAALQSSAPMGFRYHYLAGGVNTSETWQNWGQGNGSFVRTFIDDSASHGFVPAFTYYELRQSEPGRSTGDEEAAVVQNLQSRETMRAYFADLERFFEIAAATGKTTLLHVEPDAWGYLQRRAGNDARSLHVELPGDSEPNTVAGFAQRIVKLRDRVAPSVLLGYHVSIWGTGKDIAVTNEPDDAVDALAKQAADFRKTLGTTFDTTFFEMTDRDAGYAQNRDGQSAQMAWWDDDDFSRLARFIAGFRSRVPAPVVLWQVPLGNERMRAMDNSPHHYQDNKVEKLLADPARTRLREFVRAGVVAVLFGGGQAESTCACDGAKDGVTNPSPVTGNTRVSRSSDDDGGLFREFATRYRRQGALALASKVRAPSRAKGGGQGSSAANSG